MKRLSNAKKASAAKKLELAPDAWPRFEALIKSAAKMGHKPHAKPVRKKRKGQRKGAAT